MAYGITDIIYTGVTGQTLKAQLYDTSGSAVGSEVTTGFVEIGGGYYSWHYASVPDSHDGYVRFYTGTAPGTLQGVSCITPRERENADAKVTTRLAPTTAGRTLDVAATGEAGLDFDNIHAASGATTLTNITVPAVTAVTGAVGSVTGNVGGSVASVTGNVGGSVASVTGAVGSVTGNVGGNVTGSVASVTAAVTAGTVSDKTGYSLATAPPTADANAVALLDKALSGHTTAGTAGAALSSASSAGDPWTTALPGSYASGTAGNIVGNRLDAAVSGVAATVWNYLTASATTVGSFGKKIKDWVLGSDSKSLLSTDAQTGVTIPTVTTITNKVTPIDIDGLTHASVMEALIAVIAGKATVSGSTVTYTKRDGTTAKVAVTFDSSGNRTVSTIS